jgi:acyl carrier protein
VRSDDANSNDDDLRRKAARAVGMAIARARRRPVESPDAGLSLVEDLGIDSIRFVDLAFALEDALGLAEFPMQAWADEEATRGDKRYTVGSLVERCVRCLREQG